MENSTVIQYPSVCSFIKPNIVALYHIENIFCLFGLAQNSEYITQMVIKSGH